MGFFSRENEVSSTTPPPPERPAARPAPRGENRPEVTHVASGSKIVGKISGAAELVIDGEVEGEVALESRVVVGASGRVQGTVEARSVQVGGKVIGNIRGGERVEVLSSGSLEGDVVAPRVVIAEGAFFKGKVEMNEAAGARREGREGGAKTPAHAPAHAAAPVATGATAQSSAAPRPEKATK